MTANRWLAVVWVSLLTSGVALAQPAEKAAPAAAPKAKVAKRRPGKAVDLAPQLAALASADLEVAAKASTALGASDQPAAHDALLDALALGVPPEVAVPAIAAVAQHPAPADVVALRRYAGHHNPVVRSAALGALASYPDKAARAAIVAGLADPTGAVRGAAAAAAARGRVRDAIEPLLALLARGEETAARGLAEMADVDLVAKLADQLGKVPEPALALALGLVLKRPDFGPDAARVEIVRAIAKIQHPAATAALADYVDTTPTNPPRASRQEAQDVVEARRVGGAP